MIMKKFLLILVVAISSVVSANAQKFVVDPLFSDSSDCYEVVLKDTVWCSSGNYKPLWLPKGYEFENVNSRLTDNKIVLQYKGKFYEISHSELVFSDDNPDDIENPLSEKAQTRHSLIGRFYLSLYPISMMMILLLVAAAMSLIYIKTKIQVLRMPTLFAVPIAILLASLIEVFGVMALGDDFFWWCDFDKNGFFASLLLLIPFAAAVAFQLYSIKLYEKVIFDGDESKKISIKPVAWSLVTCIPVTIASMLIWILVFDLKQNLLFEIVMLAIFFITLGLGLVITLKRNIATLGFINGILITAFSVVYIIGCIMSVWAVIVIVFKVILTIIAFIAGAFILMMVCGRRRFRGSDGRIYEEI